MAQTIIVFQCLVFHTLAAMGNVIKEGSITGYFGGPRKNFKQSRLCKIELRTAFSLPASGLAT